MGRSPCCDKVGLKRGPWTPEEDQKLIVYINENGHGSWRALPKKAGLLRCGKSCRLRWTNYLRPDIKRGEFSLSEEQSIIQLHALLGNRWSAIASHLPKRTDNEIKNYWNTHLKKKLVKMGLDPVTHKPKVDNTLMSSNADPPKSLISGVDDKDNPIKDKNNNSTHNGARTTSFAISASNSSNGSSVTNHMAQWESARLEAEARLAQEAQMRAKGLWSSRPAVPKPLNPAPLSALSPWSLTKPLGISTVNSSAACMADTFKALNAVELMQVLHNWEKSLQGQAGMMWPESWRLPSMHFPFGEAQAESSSCSSPGSDANTNNNTSPSVTAGPHGMDHSSPTSTLCSLDSHHMKQKGMQSPFVSGMHSSAHMRKLSWSDALAPPPVKPEMHLAFCMQGVSGKVEEDSSTFSSLMRDAVINVDGVASAFICSQEGGGGVFKTTSGKDVIDEVSCGIIKDEEVTCEKLSFMVEDQHTTQEKGGACRAKIACATYKEGSVGNVSTCADIASGENDSKFEQKSDENLSSVLLSSGMDLEEQNIEDGTEHSKENKGDDECHSYAQESNEEQSMCAGAESMSAEMFKDLPKLKSEASTTHLTSFSTLLSDDISDYWSSIMLKESSLQQGDMTF